MLTSMASAYQLVMDLEEIDESRFTDTELGILEMLSEGRCTPSYLAEELNKSPEYIRNRLRELDRLGAVETVHRGLYTLSTDDGGEGDD